VLDQDGDEVADRVPLELDVLLTHDDRDMVAGHVGESCSESVDDLVDGARFLFGVHGMSLRRARPLGKTPSG
jgi:hypothetical protein